MSFVKFLITLFYIITIFILEDFILYTMLTDDTLLRLLHEVFYNL